MKKIAALLFLTFFFQEILFAGEIIQIEPGISLYASKFENPDHKIRPVILLLPEWWGMTSQMMVLADDFAESGFAAYALDLYGGRVAQNPYEASELMRSLPEAEALEKIRKALDFLQKKAPYLPKEVPLGHAVEPGLDGNRIGVIGWSMGGGLALKIAAMDDRVKAVAVYYGKFSEDDSELSKLKAPILGIFAGKDPVISRSEIENFKHRLDLLGKRSELLIYENAEHSFMDWHIEAYQSEDVKDSWDKTVLFFRSNLG